MLWVVLLLSIGLHPNAAWAAITGKIVGQVMNPIGVPLPGTSVLIEEQQLGALTNTEGRYVIPQVPSGRFTVEASLAGYQTVRQENVIVNADRTTEVNFVLRESAPVGPPPQSLSSDVSEPGLQKAESEYFVAFTGGAGFAGSATEEGIEDFPDTKFKGGKTLSASLRLGHLPGGGGWCIDVSYYQFALRLRENEDGSLVSLGTVEASWVTVTPGYQMMSKRSAGLFVGLLGLGKGRNRWVKSADITQLEASFGGKIDTEVEDSFIFTLFPVKVDIFLARNVCMGISFPGFLAANAGTTWKVNGQKMPELSKKLFLSNWQILGTVSLVL